MSLGANHFESLYAAQEDSRGTITTKNRDVITCLCAGLNETLLATDEGKGSVVYGLIHIPSTSLTDTGFEKGDLLKFTDAAGISRDVRINGIGNKSGFVTITVMDNE